MENFLDEIADRYAKKIAKKEMRKISKIVYKAIRAAFKEGWIENDGVDQRTPDFCKNECKMWNTEYRCRDCTK